MEFDPTSYTVSESGRFANITVVKRGQTTLAVSVDFSTADDTAIGTDRYTSRGPTAVASLNVIGWFLFCSWSGLHNDFTDGDLCTHSHLTSSNGPHHQ